MKADGLTAVFRRQLLDKAIAVATERSMGWKTERYMQCDLGIPVGMPYLTGLVIHCEGTEEIRAN